MADKPAMTPDEAKTYVHEAIYPCNGEAIHTREWPGESEDGLSGGGYEAAAHSLARALLLTAEADPALMDLTEEQENDPTGWEAANNDKLWKATQEKFPDLVRWLGGPTGFQFGWAHNMVRHALGFAPTGNPAIVNVGKDE